MCDRGGRGWCMCVGACVIVGTCVIEVVEGAWCMCDSLFGEKVAAWMTITCEFGESKTSLAMGGLHACMAQDLTVLSIGVLELADSYCEKDLKKQCEKLIWQSVTVDNVATLMTLASKYKTSVSNTKTIIKITRYCSFFIYFRLWKNSACALL